MKRPSRSTRIIGSRLLFAMLGSTSAFAADGDRIGADRSGLTLDGPSTYDRVESEVDRGTGRIVDQQTWEIDRVQNPPEDRPVREALEEERDREFRIENRNREIQKELELDRLQRPILGQPVPETRGGAEARLAPPTTQQAQDRADLTERITRAVLDRDDEITRILTDPGLSDAQKRLERVRVMYDFERRLRQILEEYEIRGVAPVPTTRPTGG